ncbi:hypothetical protein QC763_0071230 [Podospora pseudopauciseta]|uniref:Uncharacterized protein n=1 Tax=Podospora pseudopauciseta TaxID=2093780 RepID=A0ABR0HEK9_9PEZI|nr:hypothetical protein QC763_0071230 [Podospora pseudopauciseta]
MEPRGLLPDSRPANPSVRPAAHNGNLSSNEAGEAMLICQRWCRPMKTHAELHPYLQTSASTAMSQPAARGLILLIASKWPGQLVGSSKLEGG